MNPEIAKSLRVSNPIDRLHVIEFAGKTKKTYPIFSVNMKVGELEVPNLKVLVKDIDKGLKVPGVIGINFLNKYRTSFEFDNDTIVLRIWR